MKQALIILFLLFSLAMWSSPNADEAAIAQSQELSADRQANQKKRSKGVHSHNLKPKSKYDLRNIDGKRGGDGDKHVHKHGDNHDHKAKSKYDLRDGHRHDHGKAHGHDHGDVHKHGHTPLHDPASDHSVHDSHGHDGHGHGHGYGGHEHGYDRLWHVGISG